jgi:DNA repair exonuclease SbcCD ATPase subunit
MIRKLGLVLLVFTVAVFFSACGGEGAKKEEGKPETEVQKEQSSQPEAEAESKGTAVAKEILNIFDQLVAETADLVKDKPEAADLKPKLEELYAKYTEKMKELNVKYLALKDEDIALFGDCNGYLGEYRGKHVFERDKILDEYIAYYNFTKGEQEIVDMLTKGMIDILNLAVAR